MIFIDKEQKLIMIPKHVNIAGELNLTLRHNLTNTEYVFNDLPNNDTSSLFWTFTIDFSNLPTGEYNYYLNGVETGLLQISQSTTSPISYTTEKTIIQYGDR